MRRWVKYIVGLTVVGTIAALGGGSALGQTTTSTASGGSTATYGPGTNGNAKAAALVAKDPMTGPKGTGLTNGVTATSINVGCYLNASSFPGAADGFKARFERANTNKELPGGRQINFNGCKDDGVNPQTNLSIVQAAVQQDKDFAMVGVANTLGTASTDFLSQNQVPTFSWSFLDGECGARWMFGFNGCLVTGFPGQKHTVYQANLVQLPIQAAGLTSKTAKFALQSQDNDSGHTGNITIGNMVKAITGSPPVYVESNIPSPSTGADLTPFATAIKAANPNILLSLVDFPTVPPLTAKMAQVGYTGENVNYVAYIPGLLGSSPALSAALQGATVSAQTVPTEANTAYIKQIEADLKAEGAATGSFITSGIATAYAEADVLVSMFKAVGKTLNTKTFDQKINGGGYTYKSAIAGGPGQMEYPSMHFIAADCAAMLKIGGTSYTQTVPFTCVPSVIGK
jgi:hypothetical protein